MLYANMTDNGLGALVLTTGTPVAYVPAQGTSLANSTTYVFPLGSERSAIPNETALASVHIKWAAAVSGTITIETCNFPVTLSANSVGGPDVTPYDGAAGNWIQENPSTAYVGVTGTGNSASALTITMGGTNAGGCMIHVGNMGARRVRVKIATTVGGLVRVYPHGKVGA